MSDNKEAFDRGLDLRRDMFGVAGADFQVLSPPELIARVRDWGIRFTRAAGPPAGT